MIRTTDLATHSMMCTEKQSIDNEVEVKRVEWIDSLKAIAILMVIVVHVSQILVLPEWAHAVASFGAMGVQLFFLLSAYCLCMTWRKNVAHDMRGAVGGYLLKKYKRLAPWYVAGITIYAVLAMFGIGPMKQSNYTITNVISNILLCNGFIPSAQNAIVPGGWSISCIAVFVFLAPLFMNRIADRTVMLMMLVGFMGIVVSFFGYHVLGWSRFYAYCSPFNQAIVFVMGVAYWHFQQRNKVTIGAPALLGILVSCFVLSVLAVIFDKANAIFYRHILVSLSFLALMDLARQSDIKWGTWLGRHSYEVFILHFAVIGCVRKICF